MKTLPIAKLKQSDTRKEGKRLDLHMTLLANSKKLEKKC